MSRYKKVPSGRTQEMALNVEKELTHLKERTGRMLQDRELRAYLDAKAAFRGNIARATEELTLMQLARLDDEMDAILEAFV